MVTVLVCFFAVPQRLTIVEKTSHVCVCMCCVFFFPLQFLRQVKKGAGQGGGGRLRQSFFFPLLNSPPELQFKGEKL